MSNDNADSGWMDEVHLDVQPSLTLTIELTIESGRTYREILGKAGWAIRTTALVVEEGKLEDGHHPIKTLHGEDIGELYLDHYGIGER